MRHFSEITDHLKSLGNPDDLFAKSGNHWRNKLECQTFPMAFDVEVTSLRLDDGTPFPIVYRWAVAVDQEVFSGTTIDEFYEFDRLLRETLKVDPKTRRALYFTHNVAYEFEFLRKRFEWDSKNSFFKGRNKPLKAVTVDGSEFRCSYQLSGRSLAKLPEIFNPEVSDRSLRKMDGDLDYKKVRHPMTAMTVAELEYLRVDVLIVTNYIRTVMADRDLLPANFNQLDIPLTATSAIRTSVGRVTLGTHLNKFKVKPSQKRYRDLMKSCALNPEFFYMFDKPSGGFTHASILNSDMTLEGVSSWDLTSCHPSRMLAEKFPMSAFKPAEVEHGKQTNWLDTIYKSVTGRDNHAFKVDVTFINLRLKDNRDGETFLSSSKCARNGADGKPEPWRIKSPADLVHNGRIRKTDEARVILNEELLKILMDRYAWDEARIHLVLTAVKDYLPDALRKEIVSYFKEKDVLKVKIRECNDSIKGLRVKMERFEGKSRQLTVEDELKAKQKELESLEYRYALIKVKINSLFGICGTNPVRDGHSIDIDGDWLMEVGNPEKAINQENKRKNRWWYFPWGDWIASKSQRALWEIIPELDEHRSIYDCDANYVYADTDSIKLLNGEKYKHLFMEANDRFQRKLETAFTNRMKGVDLNDIKGVGLWDFEGTSDLFRVMGAKRYMGMKGGELSVTVAGLNKRGGVEYFMDRFTDPQEMFAAFTHELHFPKEYARKLTATYVDGDRTELVTDYQGHSMEVRVNCGVFMEEVSYSFNTTSEELDTLLYDMNKRGLDYIGPAAW